ncbi:MAG: hypothetical protein IJZ29_05345 [Clostridia bacterium]|nr:hypothetical protein [Clostridia bacterium]
MDNFIKVLLCVILLGIIVVGAYFIYDGIADHIAQQAEIQQEQQEQEESAGEVNTDSIQQIVVGGAVSE